jgi:glyoxylase-like metal-dependent hydrolase (beta-lactamase superfamily II)
MTRAIVVAVAAVLLAGVPASAQVSFVGDWSGRYHEDQPDRVPGEEPGNMAGLPVNDAARMYSDSWNEARYSVLEHQCAPYVVPYIFFGPNQFRIWETKNPDTQELIAIEMYQGTFQQRRTIWMDGRPHPPEYAAHTFMGFSTGEYHGDILTITTTHLKAGYFRRGGVPMSDRATVVEHWTRHGNVLNHVTIATDPVYLTEPYVRSQEFVQMERGNTNWLYNCEYAMEVPRDRHHVPHYLPGQNPWLGEYEGKYALPKEGVRGGAESLRPEWKPGAKPMPVNPAANGGFRPERQPAKLPAGEVRVQHVQGNVHMVVGGGANIAVQVADDGVLVVDSGTASQSDKVIAAIRQLAGDKEIRWIVNTTSQPDHVGGNEAFSKAGRTVNGNLAAVVAHENVNSNMIEAGVPDSGRPYNTYFEEFRDFPFNGEPVVLYHDEAATTDGNTVVLFRRSDVIAAGDVFSMTTYPEIDAANGGTITGTIAALNHILELTVPSKSLQEGGTYVIPGHGRLADEADVVMYRDMLVIVSDRIRDMVGRGMTLAQVRAARPTLDYDGRFGSDTGPWTTAMFVETVYDEFKK